MRDVFSGRRSFDEFADLWLSSGSGGSSAIECDAIRQFSLIQTKWEKHAGKLAREIR